MGISSRVARAAVVAVGLAPTRLKRTLLGEPVERDGLTLHPDMQALLALLARDNPDPSSASFSRLRRELDATDPVVGGSQPIGAVTEREIAGPGGSIRLRLYTPRGLDGPSPALVYFHGGGFALGSLTSHDSLCRYLAEQAQVRLAAVDYRLAPEHPFPAGVDDSIAAYRWVCENAGALGIDADYVAVGGDSAGGNLAAVVAQEMVRSGGPVPKVQLLLYPVTDFVELAPSRLEFGEGFYLTEAMMSQFTDAYLVSAADRHDVRASPLRADLHDLPPAVVVTAGFDPLRDEGEAYAEALRTAGVRVEAIREDGLIHGFANMIGYGTAAPAAMRRVVSAFQRALV